MAEEASIPTRLTVKVVDQRDNSDFFVQMRKNTPFIRLKNALCQKKEVRRDYFVFLFEGRILGDQCTPEKVSMGDGDEITAFVHCHGAGGGF